MKTATLLAQAFHAIDQRTGAVVPPLVSSTTFARDSNYALLGPTDYARHGHPTAKLVEEILTRLEEGTDALLFSSGMAAAHAVLATLRPGDHLVAPEIMYWSLRAHFQSYAQAHGLRLDLVDATNLSAIERAVQPGVTKLLWIETPANPTLDITDIHAAAAIAHAAGAALVVDSTAATPLLTRPLELGADIVLHSATKYLNGHGDLLAGALVTKVADERWRLIREHRVRGGAVLGAFEAWLLLRGMRTLDVRLRRQCETALEVARRLEGNKEVSHVLYPGLEGHSGHAIAKRQMLGGFGGMLAIRVRGGREAALRAACRMQVFVRATSLGGVESLVEHRKSVEGEGSPVPDDLLRLSVGIEDPDDLIQDVERALNCR